MIAEFSRLTGRGVLGNKPASGTRILDEYGEAHQRTGKWIVYTSADSVFQVAAHEATVPLHELYAACAAARAMLQGAHGVSRVIARPVHRHARGVGAHPRRKDYSLRLRARRCWIGSRSAHPAGRRRKGGRPLCGPGHLQHTHRD